MAFIVPHSPLKPQRRLVLGIDPACKVVRADELREMRAAHEVIALANAQADAILQEAREEFEAERVRGFEQGKEEARLEQAELMIENVSRTVDYFSKVEGRMVDLVMQAVRKIVDDFDEKERVLITVRSVLSVVRNQKHMTLRLNPQQVQTVQGRVNEILAAYPGVGYVDIVADSRLKADACILESDIGLVEASMEGQLEALRKAFHKVLGSRV